MINQQTARELEQQMRIRREEILDLRDSLNSSRTILQEPESELEDMAGKEIMLEGVDHLDDQVVAELRMIDVALANMQSGKYGRCEMCHRPITAKRLRALPWTSICKRCALNREMSPAFEMPEDEQEPEPRMSDAQIVQVLWDELDQKEDLILNDLSIDSNDGTIYLTGHVPSDKTHQQLIEIIEEDLGYEDVIDHIGIDGLDRRIYGTGLDEEIYEKETAMQGEAPEDDF